MSPCRLQLLDYLVELAYVHFSSQNVDLHGAVVVSAHHAHGHRPAPHHHPSSASVGGGSDSGSAGDEETGRAPPPCPEHGEGCHTLLKQKADASQIVGIYMMEAGIVFHSVLIGLALGVTGGTSFKTLLIALSFHQFFEGFAIGSAAVDSGLGAKKSFVMGVVYSLTTPVGIAIGVAVRETYNGNSTAALLTEGILDSISTGILIYVVLVELINPMFTQSKWLRAQKWWLQMLSFASLYAGAGVMAGIGNWV